MMMLGMMTTVLVLQTMVVTTGPAEQRLWPPACAMMLAATALAQGSV